MRGLQYGSTNPTPQKLRPRRKVVKALLAVGMASGVVHSETAGAQVFFLLRAQGVGNTVMAQNSVIYIQWNMGAYPVMGTFFNNGAVTGWEFYLSMNPGRHASPNQIASVRHDGAGTHTVNGAFVIQYTGC